MSDKENWLDFQKIKEAVEIERVLQHYCILEHLEKRGDELVGWCPLGEEHGKGDSFAMNIAKKSFQCFACKARGSVLDFVRKYDGSDLRTAALRIAEIMAEGESPSPASPPAKKTRPYGKQSASAKSEAPAKPREPSIETFSWDEALELVRQEKLDPQYLVVLHPTFR
jgi:DNA primase